MPLLFLLTGCCNIFRSPETVPYRVVTQVQIRYQNGALQSQRQFFREENIRNILAYLRYIDPYGTPKEDPEQAAGRIFDIYVIYSDGSQHLYEQRADQYMRIDGGPWKLIDSQKALTLSGLFGMMPSDPVPVSETHIPPLIRPRI
ncbi:MAG: hypothetical protein E7455_05350 [Ruminococcaceae bacterium]|nr:hypothetical protein [Oscillospiraceae bacterium]